MESSQNPIVRLSSGLVQLKPRVLFIITDSGVGGTEKVVGTLLSRLSRDKVSPCGVVVLKNKRENADNWIQSGVPVTTLGMKRWPAPGLLRKLRASIHAANADVVHAFLYHSIQLTRLIHLFDKSFSLITSPRVNYRFASKFALVIDSILKRTDDLILCESNAGRHALINLGYGADKTVVVQNGVDNEIYQFHQENRRRLRREWNVAEKELLIGSVGRLHPQKGYDLLISAIDSLRGGPVPFKVLLVGEGPMEKVLLRMIEVKKVPVRILPNRPDIPAVLSAFDIYVQSSRYEGLSNALLEAMSVGLPCVATAVDGTMDLSEDGKNILLVKPEDPLSLAIGIGHLLEKPTLRQELSANAKITAQAQSIEKMVNGFEDIYSNLPNSKIN